MQTTLLNRLPIERLMDLKIDYAFKQLFGNEKNKEITIVFLDKILEPVGWGSIKDISFTNSDAGGEYVDDHESRLALSIVTVEDQLLDVEILFTDKKDMVQRSLCSWSSIFRKPLNKNLSAKAFEPVVSINILTADIIVHYSDRYHSIYQLCENEEMYVLTDMMELHFIEMNKVIQQWKEGKLDPWNDILERWLLLLAMVDCKNDVVYLDIYRELEKIAIEDEVLRCAFSNWKEMSSTEEQVLAYESRLKHL